MWLPFFAFYLKTVALEQAAPGAKSDRLSWRLATTDARWANDSYRDSYACEARCGRPPSTDVRKFALDDSASRFIHNTIGVAI